MGSDRSLPNVLILLSSYNGEKYIDELLVSLIGQIDVNLYLLVRDDGSTDKTIDKIQQYGSELQISVIRGMNIGADNSFKHLISEARNLVFDYVAFCDQDDIWLHDKLSRSIEQLNLSGKSHYSSKRLIYSKHGNKTKLYPKSHVHSDLQRRIFENPSSGCTVVVSREHFLKLVKLEIHNLHGNYDHILQLTSSALNEVHFDHESRIFYRVHENNSVGIPKLRNRSIVSLNLEISRKLLTLRQVIDQVGEMMGEDKFQFCSEFFNKRGIVDQFIWIAKLPPLRDRTIEDFLLKIILLFRGRNPVLSTFNPKLEA